MRVSTQLPTRNCSKTHDRIVSVMLKDVVFSGDGTAQHKQKQTYTVDPCCQNVVCFALPTNTWTPVDTKAIQVTTSCNNSSSSSSNSSYYSCKTDCVVLSNDKVWHQLAALENYITLLHSRVLRRLEIVNAKRPNTLSVNRPELDRTRTQTSPDHTKAV